MPGFTNTFGGTVIYPASVSYRAVALTANVTLAWPTELATDTNVVAEIMDVTPSAGSLTIRMPPANQVSVGQTQLFFNAGSYTFTIANNNGTTITTVAAGLSYQVYLIDNTTVNGTWRVTQYGAGTSSATAGSLAGYGIKAINTTLNQSMEAVSINNDYVLNSPDRSSAIIWEGGAGTLTLTTSSTLGNDWFVNIRNSGTGAISVEPDAGGQFINGGGSLTFNPGDSATILCDGTNFFSIGFGQSVAFAFDYVSIDLTGETSPYTLAGADLNRISYSFGGTLTEDTDVIVPDTIQQYWVGNVTDEASSAYFITVKTASGTGIQLATATRAIMFCDGTNVVDADTSTISIPVQINQGGTGSSTASGARVNLGGTSIGVAVFTAVDNAAAQAAIGLTFPVPVSSGGTGLSTLTAANNALYSTSSSALTAGTLPVAAGGTGNTSYTNGQLLIGNTTGNTLTKTTLTAGTNITITNGTGAITIAAAGSGDGSVTSVVAGTGLSGGTITTTGTIALDYTAASPWTGKQTFTGSTSVLAMKLVNALEKVTTSATAATGTINYDVTTQSVLYYTSNASANWTVNLRASSGTSLDTAMATGESITAVFLVTQGSTAYYNNVVQVDGTTSGVTTKWLSVVPSFGNTSGIDSYTYTVIKTGSATFTVLASQTPFV